MLNTPLNNRPTRARLDEQEAHLHPILLRDLAELTNVRARRGRPFSNQAQNVLLMTLIVAATLGLLVVLDHAGIHLPIAYELPSSAFD